MKIKDRIRDFYEHNETKVDVGFFLGGFIFDIMTLSDIDDIFGISQQLVYLFVLGSLLYYDFLTTQGIFKVSPRFEKIWSFRQPAIHFILGSLLSLYSLFFLKSASLFSSITFVVLLMGLMIANELKSVRESRIDLKIALYVICIFSFFSMIVPVVLGFVGWVPFLLALGLTGLTLYGVLRLLQKKISNNAVLMRGLIGPGTIVLSLFFVFYLVGWIPPVPISIQSMGIYHKIEKVEGQYLASHEKPNWAFWLKGDQNFVAEPGDKIFFFAEIFSPARFNDAVLLNWYFKDPKKGWVSTDQITMSISGGRKSGYRGFTTKQNYQEGDWRILVETTDGREIGRIYFNVTKVAEANPTREFQTDIF